MTSDRVAFSDPYLLIISSPDHSYLISIIFGHFLEVYGILGYFKLELRILGFLCVNHITVVINHGPNVSMVYKFSINLRLILPQLAEVLELI